ncbi:MAG: tRNA (adenosine(37)-N6)-threonylcarbamoyltransferase complex dimerization subunit type 1 TsaB [Verrucomicrobiota bacterium]
MITLAIDTSTPLGSVAVIEDGAILFNEQFNADRSHSAHLFSSLERALQTAPRYDQIVVGLGPGSYSGVRIAISAAIGFGFGMKAPLLGIASMAALETDATHYQAIGDARRDTFYYTQIRDGVCLEGPLLLTAEALREKLSANPGLPVFTPEPFPSFPEATPAHPSAERLARLAEAGNGFHSTGDLEPIYLREPHITRPKNPPAFVSR